MSTQNQIDANRINATLSTGPRTPEGKAISSQNACKHGLTAKQLVILPGEEDEFNQLHEAHLADAKPVGAIELQLFSLFLLAAWKLRRIDTREAALVFDGLDPLANPNCAAQLSLLERYRRTAERSFYKALNELRAVQTQRCTRDLLSGDAVSAAFPSLVDVGKLRRDGRGVNPERRARLTRKLLNGATISPKLDKPDSWR